MKSFFGTLFGTQEKEITDRLFFIKTENIDERIENKTGVIVDIKYDDKYIFEEIILEEKPEIITKKQGLSKVIQDLKLVYKNPGRILDDLEALKEKKKGISILHIGANKECFIYGEHAGLDIIELDEKNIVLEGEEADSFFNVDYDLAIKITTRK